jgi:hypothetical protein
MKAWMVDCEIWRIAGQQGLLVPAAAIVHRLSPTTSGNLRSTLDSILSPDPPKHRGLDGSPQASGPSEAGWRFT